MVETGPLDLKPKKYDHQNGGYLKSKSRSAQGIKKSDLEVYVTRMGFENKNIDHVREMIRLFRHDNVVA